MDWKQFAADLQPVILQLASVIITGLVAWMAAAISKRTGVAVETSDRDALHSALNSGVRAALNNATISKGQAIASAIDHAKISVPDAIGRLQPSVPVLASIAGSKMETALAERATVAAVVPPR